MPSGKLGSSESMRSVLTVFLHYCLAAATQARPAVGGEVLGVALTCRHNSPLCPSGGSEGDEGMEGSYSQPPDPRPAQEGEAPTHYPALSPRGKPMCCTADSSPRGDADRVPRREYNTPPVPHPTPGPPAPGLHQHAVKGMPLMLYDVSRVAMRRSAHMLVTDPPWTCCSSASLLSLTHAEHVYFKV